MLVSRSHADSGRSTAAILPASVTGRSNSGLTGGSRRSGRPAIDRSAMVGLLLFDAVGKQHVVDPQLALLELGAADAQVVVVMAIELGLHLTGVRRHDQDAIADDDRLLDRVGDEE